MLIFDWTPLYDMPLVSSKMYKARALAVVTATCIPCCKASRDGGLFHALARLQMQHPLTGEAKGI